VHLGVFVAASAGAELPWPQLWLQRSMHPSTRPEICGPSAFGYNTVGWVGIAIASRVATGYRSLLFGKVVGGRASSRCTAARNEFSPIWAYRAH